MSIINGSTAVVSGAAARFYVLIKYSYGAKLGNFGGQPRNVGKAVDYLQTVSKRLNQVVIENRDFEKLISIYDRKDALFYLDPPYHQTEKYYTIPFTEADHKRLRDCLGELKGRFILSYNDDAFIRQLYKDYSIESVSRRNSLNERYDVAKERREFKELLITNFNTNAETQE